MEDLLSQLKVTLTKVSDVSIVVLLVICKPKTTPSLRSIPLIPSASPVSKHDLLLAFHVPGELHVVP